MVGVNRRNTPLERVRYYVYLYIVTRYMISFTRCLKKKLVVIHVIQMDLLSLFFFPVRQLFWKKQMILLYMKTYNLLNPTLTVVSALLRDRYVQYAPPTGENKNTTTITCNTGGSQFYSETKSTVKRCDYFSIE